MTRGRYSKKVGKRFGRLVVIERLHKNEYGHLYFKCLCDCGNEAVVKSGHLGKGGTKSCGCLHKDVCKHLNRAKDMTGQRHGRWLVLSRAPNSPAGNAFWNCRCDCGTEKAVSRNHLLSDRHYSCGCHKREANSKAQLKTKIGDKYGRLTIVSRYDTHKGHPVWMCRCDCGKMKPVLGSALRSGNTLSCGCYHKEAQRRKYDPDLYLLSRQRGWAKRVMDRDGYKCVICWATHEIEAHHLYSRTDYPEKAKDIDNGVTLCVDCHHEFHDHYGKGHNDPDQFLEYACAVLEEVE